MKLHVILLLSFIYFRWDYLEITDKGVNPVINRFCGWDHFDYISQSNDVNIKFRSDRSFEDSGFLLDFKPVDKGRPKILNVVNHNYCIIYVYCSWNIEVPMVLRQFQF